MQLEGLIDLYESRFDQRFPYFLVADEDDQVIIARIKQCLRSNQPLEEGNERGEPLQVSQR